MKLPITLSFDKFVSLTRAMFISNRYIEINIAAISKWWTRLDWCMSSINDLDEMNWRNEITITSIEVRLPQFSIGDTVMIVDTGEIGEIEFQYKGNWQFRIFWEWWTKFRFSENLVKIDTSLLPLLQD